MYFFVSKLSKNKYISTLSAILYMTMPYHLTDVYIRNAFGETLSFIFIPLVFLGLYNLFNKEKYDWLLCVGSVGLVLTHNLMTFLTAIFSIIYLFINLAKFKDKSILKKFIINLLLIICICSFFILPMLQTYFVGNYQVYQKDAMFSVQNFINNALDLKSLFYTDSNSTFVFEIGLHILIMLFASIFAIKDVLKSSFNKEYILFLALGILTLWMSTKYFPWKIFGGIFNIVQFPWRFLVFSNFFFAIICAINMGVIIKKFKLIDVLFISFITILYIMLFVDFIPLTSIDITNISKLDLGIVNENQSEAINGMGKGEYLPANSNNNRLYILNRSHDVLILQGNAYVENSEKNSQFFKCIVNNINNDTILEFPYIYYPGYLVKINGKSFDTFESDNGFLAVKLDNTGVFDIEINYNGTNLMHLSNLISGIGVLLFFIYVCSEKSQVPKGHKFTD